MSRWVPTGCYGSEPTHLEGAEVDEQVPGSPRPRRAADPAPSDVPEPIEASWPQEDAPARARRALDPLPEEAPASPDDDYYYATEGDDEYSAAADHDVESPRVGDDQGDYELQPAYGGYDTVTAPGGYEPASPRVGYAPVPTQEDYGPAAGDSDAAGPGSPSWPTTPSHPISPLAAAMPPGDETPASSPSATGGATPSDPGSPTRPSAGSEPPRPPRGPSRALESEFPRGRRNLIIGVVAAVVVIALIVGVILLRGRLTGQGPGAASTPSQTAAPVLSAASMITVDDVRSLNGEAAWAETLTQDRVDATTPRPSCVLPDAEGTPLPVATMVREIQAGGDDSTYVLHEAVQFDSVEDATTASELWTHQLGDCSKPISLILNGWNVSGVGDAATGVSTVVQDTTSIHHTVQLARTGSVVHVIDASRPDSTPEGAAVAGMLGAVVGRTCEAAGGACSDDPTAAGGLPPSTAENPEFLANADFPRITPGTGRWGSTPVATSFEFFGTQCEGRDLASVSGPSARKHRAYLLQEDAAAPEGTFGVDEYILTFDDKGGADALVDELTTSIDGCSNNMLTATIDKTDAISSTANNWEVTGQTWVVTQQIDQNTKQRYRIGLVQVDRDVIYTLIPTGETFDFSNEQWRALSERAGQRLASTL